MIERHITHLPVNRVEEDLHAFLGIGLFPACMREQLHGRDIGVAVNDAARHHRACVGLRFGNPPELRDEVDEKADIDAEPEDERHGKPPVGCRHHRQHRDEIDDDVNQNVEHLHHHFAHGKRGLHDLGAERGGKFVGEEGHGRRSR